ncbi:MAG TPA: hypothetical protein VHP33_12005 [Polyangiaceae bacterium]|nr:hypothetical protein [Polyangiaceae bacterium]
MASASSGDVQIELTEGEYIAARGKTSVTWLIKLNDAWVHISEWPGGEVERCQTRSGMVWQNLTRLTVPPGARLTRVESRPAPYAKRDALDYLKRGAQPARRVFRQEFRVGRRGDLLRDA